MIARILGWAALKLTTHLRRLERQAAERCLKSGPGMTPLISSVRVWHDRGG